MAAREYEIRARADSAAATRDGILTATIALAYELENVDFSLDLVAVRAGRSVQTILRHFGSRDALFEAAIQRGMAEVAAERGEAGPSGAPRVGPRLTFRALRSSRSDTPRGQSRSSPRY